MNKEDYIRITNEKLSDKSKEIMLEQIDNYYEAKKYCLSSHCYKIGDNVKLLKGTLLHGTYKNIEGLKEIAQDGLLSGWFIDGRLSKYPNSVGVWNLKQDYLLKDYINFYSGATILYMGIYDKDQNQTQTDKTSIISYDKMKNLHQIINQTDCQNWVVEQTKEARFMPSLVQDRVQIGIIINGNNDKIKKLLQYDILNLENINDEDVKDFVNPNYYLKFIKDRKNKDDLFTDRESAILFGIPSNLIEGILVGKQYENNKNILNEIKILFPKCYICNLEGKVIVE